VVVVGDEVAAPPAEAPEAEYFPTTGPGSARSRLDAMATSMSSGVVTVDRPAHSLLPEPLPVDGGTSFGSSYETDPADDASSAEVVQDDAPNADADAQLDDQDDTPTGDTAAADADADADDAAAAQGAEPPGDGGTEDDELGDDPDWAAEQAARRRRPLELTREHG